MVCASLHTEVIRFNTCFYKLHNKAGRVFVGLFANSSKCAANGMAGTTGLHRKEGTQVPAGSLTEAFLIFMEAAMKKMSRTFLMKPIKMQRKI